MASSTPVKMSLVGVFMSLLCLFTLVQAISHPALDTSLTKRNPRINTPLAAAWMYIADDSDYGTIPSSWKDIKFSDVDVLYVGPVGVQSDGTFGLYSSDKTGKLSNRFRWIIDQARSQNADIKIIASQWWGNGGGSWGSALDALDTADKRQKYADSVSKFMTYFRNQGNINGWDVDYEDNNVSTGTIDLIHRVRTALNKLTDGPYYITVSPSTTQYLDTVTTTINFVNMQTYAGGSGLSPTDFTHLGFSSKQLLYGYCPESGCNSPSLSDVKSAYNQYKLGGIHTYRLNSGNYKTEIADQAKVHAFIHP